ncbi:MAG: class I SAM-dependent methyltransferase [Cyclobacteriaceae bacterium]|nr:class I SAM-dependent methyltransferase [Cyclobacteriaceae bacterium]
MEDKYRWVAPIYRRFSELVFGKQLALANRYFLTSEIEGNILIIGGGDGLDYQDLASRWKGEYWELSKWMLEAARKNMKESQFTFHLGAFSSNKTFDWVILPFVLDTMSDQDIQVLFTQLKKQLNPGAQLILSDFFPPKNTFQKLVSYLMIRVFRVITQHPRHDFPDYGKWLEENGFKLIDEKKWKAGWIQSQVWKIFKA